ncbi:hypothetical protein K439DRAFT_489677 [Ramaria rubella]|nr:hypothetical protein K439DRAFT_489677 [Ramaria rubella]
MSVVARGIHRDHVYFNFCFTWIISSVIFSLALYQDIRKHTTHFPLSPQWSVNTLEGNKSLSSTACGIQAALLSGVQPMTAFSTLTLVSKLWFDLRISIYGIKMNPQWIAWMKALILTTPYIFLVAFFTPWHFNTVDVFSQNFYCEVKGPNLLLILLSPLLTTLILLLTLPFDVLIIKIMYSHWSTFRRRTDSNPISISIIIRVLVFSVYRVVFAFASMSSVIFSSDSMRIPLLLDIFLAGAPLVAFLVLGTTKDNLTAMAAILFWWKRSYKPGVDKIRPAVADVNKERAIMDIRQVDKS